MPVLLLDTRLVKEKDLLDLVAMDTILRTRGHRFQMVFVGDGPLRQELEDRLPEAIFTGQQVGVELARWHASADIFVFPSTTEAFGNVVQEAMASGLPAVVVDKGGPAGVIEPGLCGYVARSNDPVDLANRVERLLLDAGLRRRMGENGRQLALSRTWPEVNSAMLHEYDVLLEEQQHRLALNRRVQFQGMQA
jgi:glycosyltransferase involved in cell wall biosynthesis